MSTASTILQLELSALTPAPWNARKSFDQASLAELAESIKAHGVQVPLIVRDGQGESYEIVAGHRRFEAAKLAGLGGVPCIVRELTDDQAREIGLVDNLQREDVPALEEADAYRELKMRLGAPAAIAARVGKDVSYVARRLQLVSLAEMPRKALAERLITIDHALLLARLGEDEQNTNLKWCLNPSSGIKEQVEDTIKQRIGERDRKGSAWRGYWEPQSVLDLKHHIEENVGRKLSLAPWALDDDRLIPDAGACSSCPKNTRANDLLFGDLNIAAATCEDGGCFEAKRAAFVHLRVTLAAEHKAAKPERGPAIRLSWKGTTVKPRASKPAKSAAMQYEDDGFNLLQLFRKGQWIEAKAGSCEHVRVGVTVDWCEPGYNDKDKRHRKPGEILMVCIAEKCKAHKKSYTGEKRSAGNGYDEKAEAEKRERMKAAAIEESKLRVAVASKALEQLKVMPEEALREILVRLMPTLGDAQRAVSALVPGCAKLLKTAKFDSPDFFRSVAVLSLERVAISEHYQADYGRGDFLASVKRLGYDGSSVWLKPKSEKPAVEKKGPVKVAAKPVKRSAKEATKKAAKKGGAK